MTYKLPHNPELPFIRKDWTGNPVDPKGRFVNHEFPFTTGFKDVWRWQTGSKPHKEAKKADNWKPVVRDDTSFLHNDKDVLVWLGHAWFYLRLGGVAMLLDPVIFKIPMVRHISPNPFPASTFGKIDYLILSHDHRDHMDEKSIKTVAGMNPRMQIITGLNMQNTLKKWCGNAILEMGWYQQWKSESRDLTITYLPTRHWSRRYLSDTNLRLWGAFMIQGNGKTIYFGADSGYGSHFSELPELFPKIDIAMLGIGAFRPEWFMHQAHMSPWNAVKAFNNTKANTFLPMHYGTLNLSDEPASEPLRIVEQLRNEDQIKGSVLLPDIGESVYL